MPNLNQKLNMEIWLKSKYNTLASVIEYRVLNLWRLKSFKPPALALNKFWPNRYRIVKHLSIFCDLVLTKGLIIETGLTTDPSRIYKYTDRDISE